VGYAPGTGVFGVNDPAAEIQVAASYLMQTAYLVGMFYQALKDQGLPDDLIHGIVRDWHNASIEAEEFHIVEPDE